MDQKSYSRFPLCSLCLLLLLSSSSLVQCQLDYRFYDRTCPNLEKIVFWGVMSAVRNETRMAASLLRLHFHDCFVNGCDASILLDDGNGVSSEKNARPNANSVRGYEVIDAIKANLEKACPATVSCADIVALAARDSVVLSRGPYWQVPLGRRDGTTANPAGANQDLPSPFAPVSDIINKFAAKGLDSKDVVVLSGAHTIGSAQCGTFKKRLFDFDGKGVPDPTLDTSLLKTLQSLCPSEDSSNSNLASLDPVTPNRFDNAYYKNLMSGSGLLQSDEALMGDASTTAMVTNYSASPYLFGRDFAASMLKMSTIGVLTGQDGQIRTNCRVVN